MQLQPVRSGLEQKLYDLCQQILKSENLELYDFEYFPAKGLLRVFIMDAKTQNAKLDDCVRVDKGFSPYMETEDWIPSNFVLEVSSPGIDRSLKTLHHFEQVIGKRICVICTKPKDFKEENKELKGQKKFVGLLEKLKQDSLVLSVPVKKKNVQVELSFEEIKKANLDPEFP